MVRVRNLPRRSCAAAAAGSSTGTVFPGTGTDSAASEERDWAHLLQELVRKIGDHLLHDDLTEYIRLRAVCQPWRHATDDPSALEPRFFPRNWLMLAPDYMLRRNGVPERFVNVRTGAFLHIRLPDPEDFNLNGNTEGLLILAHPMTQTVCLLNPLTMAFTDLPAISTIDHLVNSGELFEEHDIKAAGVLAEVDEQGRAQSSEPPNVVLSLTSRTRTVLVYAKPWDIVWQLVDTSCTDELEGKLPTIKGGLSAWGRFYVPTRPGDVLRMVLEPRPRLTFVARQTGSSVCNGLSKSFYLVSSGDQRKDGMILVRKKRGIEQTYLSWDVDLENRRLVRITALHDMTVVLPSITLRSSTFPTILQNQICSKDYMRRLLRGNLI